MPHRLKTPRWYTKRKIQIQNMDIWNVAFPEGAVIDPHTAWKVFWKTAASMYGDGGFREENFSSSRRSNGTEQAEVLGEYFSTLNYDGTSITYLESYDLTIEEALFQLYDPIERHPRSIFNDCKQLTYLPFVPMKTNSCRPTVVICAHQCMFCSPSSCDCNDKFSRHQFPSQREARNDHSNFSGRLSNLTGLVYLEKGRIDSEYPNRWHHCYLLFCNPEDFGFWGSEYLGIDWAEWWDKIDGGDMLAYSIANLVWCDWVVKEMRSILDFSYHPVIKFASAKLSIVGPRAYYNSHEEYNQEIMYQLSLPLPVRRYEE